jgi:peptidoglycan/LPS O-acetylase OafA/YrhL
MTANVTARATATPPATATAPSYVGPDRRLGLPASEPFVERRHGTPPYGLDRSRSSGLDGLRALAALAVVGYHLRTVSGLDFGPLNPILGGADTGVYIFFALSGYLLYKPFVRGDVDLVAYGLKRAGRIVPGYLVALFGLILVTGTQLPVHHPLPFLTISSSYNLELRGFLGNAWTLSAEILFYVTLPFIAAAARGREALVLGGLAIVSVCAATYHRLALTPENAWITGTYPLVFYAFVPGMFLALLEARFPGQLRKLHRWPYLALGLGYIVLGALTTLLPVALATGFGTVLVMGWLLNHQLPKAHALGFLGGASYAMYLWHKDALIAFGPWLGVGVTVVAASLSWVVVERPILALVHGFDARRRRRPRAVEPVPVAVP